jgi:hypothetical protein
VVKISSYKYSELTKPSIIDCNQCLQISINDLIDKVNTRQVEYKKDLPQNVIKDIISVILASPAIENEIKDLFR